MFRVHGYLGLLIIPRTVTQNKKKKKTLRCVLKLLFTFIISRTSQLDFFYSQGTRMRLVQSTELEKPMHRKKGFVITK